MAVAASASGVVVVAVLASGIDDSSGDEGDTVGAGGGSLLVDAVLFALLTVGTALVIAVIIMQLSGPGERASPERKRRLLGAVLLVAALAGLVTVLPERERSGERGATSESDDATPLGLEESESSAVRTSPSAALSGVAVGLALVLVGSLWVWTRRRGDRRRETPARVPSPDDDRHLLLGLLDDAIERLRADPDCRRAVIHTWARLEVALDTAGLPRRASEAPFDYLARILESVDASGPAVGRLTETFERAMFSPHRIDRAAQLDAIDALVAVRDELGLAPAEP